MRIAIVDDDALSRDSLCAALKLQLRSRGLEGDIDQFNSGASFLNDDQFMQYHTVFLDIFMADTSGIDVATMLYERARHCHIIFLSSSQDFLQESYAVNATYYLVKPLAEEKLTQALDFCLCQPAPPTYLLIPTRQGQVRVLRQDILYIESIQRHGILHLTSGVIESTISFDSLIQPLETDMRFFLCSRGLLVALHQVAIQKDVYFILQDGRKLPISRRRHSAALQAFQNYALSQMGGMYL